MTDLKKLAEVQVELSAWQSAFGTTQLTHAKAAFDALQQEVETLRKQVATAKDIINLGVSLMTVDQVGAWAGVRSFLEQPTEDYSTNERIARTRQETLEEAAKVCDEYARRDKPNAVTVCDLAATAIRALQHTGEDGETKP